MTVTVLADSFPVQSFQDKRYARVDIRAELAGIDATIDGCWCQAQAQQLATHQVANDETITLLMLDLCLAGQGFLSSQEGQAGRLVRASYLQLDADSADEALLKQALRCIVFLVLPLYEQDAAHDLIPPQPATTSVKPAGGPNGISKPNGVVKNAAGLQEATAEAAMEAPEEAAGSESQQADGLPEEDPSRVNGLHSSDEMGPAGDDSDVDEDRQIIDREHDEEHEDPAEIGEDSWVQGAFTVAGLVRRMSSLACDR